MIISCNTSRAQPPERALSLAKTCSQAHFSPLMEKCWNSGNTSGLFLTMKHHHVSVFHHKYFAELSWFNPHFRCICYRFTLMSRTVLNCKMLIFKFGVNIFWRDKQPPSDVLFRSLMIPGELYGGTSPAACWVKSSWMSACLIEGVTLYPTKYCVKA